ncbi:MAG: hypothetical protein AAB433_02545 [Nitrospirota bacterium]|jgi:hypothetical protein
MKITIAPQAAPSTTQVPDDLITHTPRTAALRIIERALLRGEIVRLGQTHLRRLTKGQTFQEGEDWFEATAHGLYQRFAVFNSGTPLDGPPDSYRWLFLIEFCSCHAILNPLLDQMSGYDRECALVGLIFRAAMHPSNKRRNSSPQHDAIPTNTYYECVDAPSTPFVP